ncbi:ATP-binding cassette domain-containing protein [Nonomuraea sp. B12E4]|uniref:ATP-binding cassette domain-containing protein n=1 Tax=Nonomuraea sp. B12E4 TaxID=3153564 RepID=UPI00325E7D49
MTILAEGLRKRYKEHTALAGVDLWAPEGSVLGLLGPNGAGKTTTVRILATLAHADEGRAEIAGYDVRTQARDVRRHIGLAGQYASVDELLTGRENLVLLGTLLHLGRRYSRERAEELLNWFGLEEAADRPVRTYSGGMRRRLDLATCVITNPPVLFLDEPTSGLDPASRLILWTTVRELAAIGVTVLLTTQYLEEADRLADRIAVIDEGRVIAEGTPDELKSKVGQEWLQISFRDPEVMPQAFAALSRITTGQIAADEDSNSVALRVDDGLDMIVAASTALRYAGIEVVEFALRRPSLDDVFLTLTGGSR